MSWRSCNLDVIGLGAFLYTDIFIKEVVIWELGRTRDIGTFETIVFTNGVFTIGTNIVEINLPMYSMYFSIIMHSFINNFFSYIERLRQVFFL